MRKTVILIALTLLFLVGCGSGNSVTKSENENGTTNNANEEEPIKLKFGHELQENTPHHQGAVKFKELAEERSDGRLEVEVYPAAQLGSEKEMMEGVQSGGIESAKISTAVLGNLSLAFSLFDLPFLFSERDILYQVLDGEIGDEILATLEASGLKGVTFFESGFRQYTSNVEIQSPEDMSGLQFRSMESPIVIDTYEALGVNPVPISFPEVYTSLQQGVVDGHDNPIVTIASQKFYEVQDYVTVSNHSYLGYGFIFNKDWFEKLPGDLQDVLVTSARDAAKFERQVVVVQENDFLKEIKESGTIVNELSTDQLKEFAKKTRPVHDKYADEIGEELLKKTYDLIENN